MTLQRMDHVGIVVDDLPAAIAFFAELGLELQGEMSLGGALVERVIGLEDVRDDIAMMQTPDGNSRVELIEFHSPAAEGDHRFEPANVPGLRHLCFAVDDLQATLAGLRAHGAELVGEVVNYEHSYWLCYLRGPAGIILELAEKIDGGDPQSRRS